MSSGFENSDNKPYFFTFGHGQFNLEGENMVNKYVTVWASDFGSAREWFCQKYCEPVMGDPAKFSFQYEDAEEFEQSVKRWNWKEIAVLIEGEE